MFPDRIIAVFNNFCRGGMHFFIQKNSYTYGYLSSKVSLIQKEIKEKPSFGTTLWRSIK